MKIRRNLLIALSLFAVSASAQRIKGSDTVLPVAQQTAERFMNRQPDARVTVTGGGTGVGISLAANKVKGVRACVCSEPYTAKLSRMHNDSNVLAFGARVVGVELAKMIVDEWLNASFEGGRHQRRVDMLMDIENH